MTQVSYDCLPFTGGVPFFVFIKGPAGAVSLLCVAAGAAWGGDRNASVP